MINEAFQEIDGVEEDRKVNSFQRLFSKEDGVSNKKFNIQTKVGK